MKYIYLDQMKWIEIAKYIHHGIHEPSIAHIINLMEEKVGSGEWCFPLSVIHIVETTSRLDKRSRQELANVMARFANNYTINPYLSFYKYEFYNSVFEVAGFPQLKIDIAGKVINHDILGALGSSINNVLIESEDNNAAQIVQHILKELLSDPHIFEQIAMEIATEELASEFATDSLKTAQDLELSRERLHNTYPNKDIRYRAFLGESYCDIYEKDLKTLAFMATKLGIAKNEIIPDRIFSSIESTIDFMQSVPSFHVRTALLYEILNNKSHPIKLNDNKDISFLSAAVPYCDVVITERTWVHIIKKNKLDVKYGTIVSNTLECLSSL